MKLASPFEGTKLVKALILGAEEHARRLGDASAGAEHLLLSAVDLPDGSARRALQAAGADPDALPGAIADQHAEALRTIGVEPVPEEQLTASVPQGPRRLNESGAQTFRVAARLARNNRPATMGAQIVAAVTELEHGTAARTLRAMGIDRATLRAAALEEIAGPDR